MTSHTTAPMTGTAFSHPATAAGYRRIVLRRRLWLAGFICAPIILVWVGQQGLVPDTVIPLYGVTLLVCPLLVLITVLALAHAPRIARILQSYPWHAYPCTYPPAAQRRAFAVAITVAPGQEFRLQTTPYRHNLQHKHDPHPGVIWFAGDPHSGGVVSPVGGHAPLRVAATALWERDPQLPPADAVAERAGLAKDGRYVRRWF